MHAVTDGLSFKFRSEEAKYKPGFFAWLKDAYLIIRRATRIKKPEIERMLIIFSPGSFDVTDYQFHGIVRVLPKQVKGAVGRLNYKACIPQ